MAIYPNITRGLGKLTPDLWRRLMRMLRWFESRAARMDRGAKGRAWILAKITNAQVIGAHTTRWEYAWEEVQLDATDDGFDVVTNGLTSTGDADEWDFAAINLAEAANTANEVAPGVRLSGDDYPAGMDAMPIGELFDDGGGVDRIEVVVMLWAGRDDEGYTRWFFNLSNAHDGTCS